MTSGRRRSNTELEEELSGDVDLDIFIGSADAKTSGEPSGSLRREAAPNSGETDGIDQKDLFSNGDIIDGKISAADDFEEDEEEEEEAGEELANWARGLNTEAL